MSAKPTPGPYKIRESSDGCSVLGIHGIPLGWFGRASAAGKDGNHSVGSEEARDNAEAWIAGIAILKRLELFSDPKLVEKWVRGYLSEEIDERDAVDITVDGLVMMIQAAMESEP